MSRVSKVEGKPTMCQNRKKYIQMNYVLILAAGQGQRMNSKKDKLLTEVAGHPILYYSIMAFNDHPEIDEIIVLANKTNKETISLMIKAYRFKKVKQVLLGGITRQGTVERGAAQIVKKAKGNDLILVHNGANPLTTHDEISNVIEKASEYGACIVGHKISSTIKEIDGDKIIKTHDRESLFAAETPQVATVDVFNKAFAKAKTDKFEATDEAMLFEYLGQKVKYIEASENNFKITTQADILKLKSTMGELPEDYRVGIGQDSHMFDPEEKGLVLGGHFIKDEQKLLANSDGDVVLHAIFNALSQAIGDMSLGFYADSECEKGVKNSQKYVEIVLKKVIKMKFEINSLGIMIEGSRPKIDPLVPKIKTSLAKILGIHGRRIGITATTGEKCTSFGNGLGIQCFAVASLIKKK